VSGFAKVCDCPGDAQGFYLHQKSCRYAAPCPHGVAAKDICGGCIQNGLEAAAKVHPAHYGGAENPYEAIKVIEAWGLGFCLGQVLKYVCRAGKKDPAAELEDLKKAEWYLRRDIERRERERG